MPSSAKLKTEERCWGGEGKGDQLRKEQESTVNEGGFAVQVSGRTSPGPEREMLTNQDLSLYTSMTLSKACPLLCVHSFSWGCSFSKTISLK